MEEYLQNPRRAPREAVRCEACVSLTSGDLRSTTEDIGSRGCQLVLPAPPQRGEIVAIVLSAPRYRPTLRVEGRVVWVSPQAPWRVGLAYGPGWLASAARWMEGLRQSVPELFVHGRRAPERVSLDATVFLGPVPRFPDFAEDELTVLSSVGSGIRVAEFRTHHADNWPRMQRAFFALLSQGWLTLSRSLATHPLAWKHILGDPTRPSTEELLRSSLDPWVAPPPSAREPPPQPPAPAPGEPEAPEPAPLATPIPPVPPARPAGRPGAVTPPSTPSPSAPRTPTPPPGPPVPDFLGAGVGWRAPVRPRSEGAECLYRLGLVEAEANHTARALALLRQALALAPGDPEIAAAIGHAMQGGKAG